MATTTKETGTLPLVIWVASFVLFLGFTFVIPAYTHGHALNDQPTKHLIANLLTYAWLISAVYLFIGWIPLVIIRARSKKK